MKMIDTVKPHNISANGWYNHFTGRKKYEVQCGDCLHTYSDKVPFKLSDRASSICPACSIINVWSHRNFADAYTYFTKIADKE